jgi:hypothetical protein
MVTGTSGLVLGLVVGAGCRFLDIPFDRPASEAAEQDPAEARHHLVVES